MLNRERERLLLVLQDTPNSMRTPSDLFIVTQKVNIHVASNPLSRKQLLSIPDAKRRMSLSPSEAST